MATEGFKGMAELIAGLERMGEQVQTEAAGIVRSTAQIMAATIRTQYRVRSGELVRRVLVEEGRGQFYEQTAGVRRSGFSGTLRWKVRSKAPHAHLYEKGTVVRRTASTGANRGRMPANPTFVPAAVRARAAMHRELLALLKRQTVPGMTGVMEVRQS